MRLPQRLERPLLYGLIFLSGVSGLIYEVVWHRYLAILLGAQARATAIVLAIFLGGISAGYACFGRWTRTKNWNLLQIYVRVEMGMAIWAFIFPYLFHVVFPITAKAYATLGLNNLLIDFVMSLVLIGVPTFLMGGTLPLLTQGLSRDVHEASKVHARIYGFNTLGACLGCLLAGYFFIPAYGLVEATRAAGLFNVLVGLSVYVFWAREKTESQTVAISVATLKPLTRTQKIILGIGFLSGFYLITLQTILIRLVGLSTGSSNYNFTLIVSIFIFGLGIGSLLVRRINEFKPSRLFWNQLFVAVALLALYVSGDYWSFWVHRVRLSLRDIAQNFFLFQTMLGALFASLLVIPIGLSGLTLPLCFHLMKDDRESLGERVGQLYGLNTVGCVMGALVGGYFLLNYLDLDGLFKVCVLCALATAAGAAYIHFPTVTEGANLKVMMAGGLAGLTLACTLWWPRYDHRRFVQPFRHPAPTEASFKGVEEWGKLLGGSTKLVYWKDDPNTSVGIGSSMYKDQEISRTIFINGKSDGNTRGDQFTTVLLAHIPGLLAKKLENICVIGFGTGTTVGQLTLYPEVKRIDVAEISRALIDHASLFDDYNNHAASSEKVKFNEMDAFRFLEGTNHDFDLIVSEPSNPWVAGIENLYSREFYSIAKQKMAPDGLFVQWIHTYSFSDALMQMVLKTMSGQFPYLSVFQLKNGDLAVVGALHQLSGDDALRGARRFSDNQRVRRSLLESGVTRYETVLALELVPPALIAPMTKGVDEHTLESPKLSNEAAKAFFVGTSGRIQSSRRLWKEFYPSVDSSLLGQYLGNRPVTQEMADGYRFTFCENTVSKNSPLCEESLAIARYINPQFVAPTTYEDSVPPRELASLATLQRLPPKKPFNTDDLQNVYAEFDAYKKYYSPLAHFSLAPLNARVNYCLATARTEDELFGECLLQRLVIIEATRLPGDEFFSAAKAYLEWFPRLPANSPNRGKLEEARNILVKMMDTPK